MILTAAQLTRIMPRANAASWVPLLNSAMNSYQITTPARVAAFLAQIAVESGELCRLIEELSYTAQRLMAVWPKRFPDLATANLYAGKPAALASLVYANRLGNGPPDTGDGWRYRGRGLIQITGRANYRACAKGIAQDLEARPELLEQPFAAVLSAAWYWQTRGCSELADSHPGEDETEDFQRITTLINGGLHGLPERLTYWSRARKVLAT